MLFFSRSRNGQCIQTLSDAQDSISCVCMDDTCIITGLFFCLVYNDRSIDGSIRTYDIRAGQLHQDSVNSDHSYSVFISSYLFNQFV